MLSKELIAQLTLLSLLLPVTLGALAIAGMRGCLSRQRLSHAPARSVVIQGQDMLAMMILILLGMILGGLVQQAIPLEPADHPTTIALQRLCGQLASYLPAAGYLLLGILRRQRGSQAFGLGRVTPSHIKSAVLATMLAIPAVMSLSTLGSAVMLILGIPLPKAGHELLELLSHPDARYAGLVISVSAVLVAPVVEEILFRGLLQSFLLQRLGTHRRWVVITLASILFALVHWGSVPPTMLPALFALGMILGWLYETTGSLAPAILLHVLFNGINLLLASVLLN